MPLPPRTSTQYAKLLALCNDRITLSDQAMGGLHSTWKENEKSFQAYIDLPKSAEARKSKARDKAEYPGPAPLVIPKVAAMTVTLASYLHGIFTRRYPVFECDGLNPGSVRPAKLMELMLDYQFARAKGCELLWYHIIDHLKYGFAATAIMWEERFRVMEMPTEVEDVDVMMGLPLGTSRLENMRSEVKCFEGNRLYQIDPYRCYPDPRLPLSQLQEGEFFAWSRKWTLTELNARARDGFYENVEFMQQAQKDLARGDLFPRAIAKAFPRAFGNTSGHRARWRAEMDPQNPTVYEVIIDLVPKTYGLGDSEDVERWMISVANGVAILRADPLDLPHGNFPVVASEYLPDGHTFLSGKSYVENLTPLQEHVSWLMNIHRENQRKFVNDVIVFDPVKINPADLEQLTPGKRIRLQPAGQGGDVRSAIFQLEMQDVTVNNPTEAAALAAWMDQLGYTPPSMQGQPSGARTTAREVNIMAYGSNTIVQMFSTLLSEQMMIPMADQMIGNIQGRSEMEQWLRVVGPEQLQRLAEVGISPEGRLVNVRPEDIQGEIFYVPTDGTYPLDQQYKAQQLMQFMQVAGRSPPLSQQYDLFEVSRKFFEALGIKNIDAFKNPMLAAMGPEALARGVQSGNLAPANDPDAQREAGISGQGSPEGTVAALLAQQGQNAGDMGPPPQGGLY